MASDACDRPDFDWVLPNLAIGGHLSPAVAGLLATRHGIRRVVDLRDEEEDDLELLARHGVELLRLPTPDLEPVAQRMLWTGVEWVSEALARGERVLIHCQYGIGRSALLACCVLVGQGDTPAEALERAKRARAKVCPSPEQLHALLQWAADWHRERRTECPPVTWDDLARIAYRHLAHEADRTGEAR
jgi:protein-tyrosine phosphatase